MTAHIPTDRQQRFIEEYLLDLNATQAAQRAGYSAQTARQAGADNLSKPVIRRQIQEALSQRSIRTGITADEVIARLREDLDADVADLFDVHGCLRPIDQWPAVWRRGLVTRLRIVDARADGHQMRTTTIRLADKTALLRLLGRHLGAFG